MKRFYEKVDRRSTTAMCQYLETHFLYDTMNSWNRSTSYANCMKIHRLELPADILHKAFEMLECKEVFEAINQLLHDWAEAHQWRWQAGFNGRSGGYLVLYSGGLDPKNARTAQCDECGKLTWHKQDTPCTSEYCDGTLKVLDEPVPQIVLRPGCSVDQDEDFSQWDFSALKSRVELIQAFDRLCDEVVDTFVSFCRDYDVVDEEIMVPKSVKVLKPVLMGA